MIGRRYLVLAFVACPLACQPGQGARLVWEGEGPATVRSANEAARTLVAGGPGVHLGTWGDSSDATFQILEVESAETPHLHRDHDLTVVLLRGNGTLAVAGRLYELAGGDVVHIGRGRSHHFRPHGRVIGLAIYTPGLGGKDYQQSTE